jgi:hypothetical protein
MSRYAGSSICQAGPRRRLLSPPAGGLSICRRSSQICARLDCGWPGLLRIFSRLSPKPLTLSWAVRAAGSLKGVASLRSPTSHHLCDERPVSSLASYKAGIPPSPAAGRAEGLCFVSGSILLLSRVASSKRAASAPAAAAAVVPARS